MTEAIFAFNFYILPPGQPAHHVAPLQWGFFPVPGRVNVVFPVEGFLALTFFLGFLMAQLGCKGLDRRCTTQRVSSCFVFLPVCHSPANSAFNEYDM